MLSTSRPYRRPSSPPTHTPPRCCCFFYSAPSRRALSRCQSSPASRCLPGLRRAARTTEHHPRPDVESVRHGEAPSLPDPIRRSSSRPAPGPVSAAHPVKARQGRTPCGLTGCAKLTPRRGPGDCAPPRSGSPARRSLVGERRTIDRNSCSSLDVTPPLVAGHGGPAPARLGSARACVDAPAGSLRPRGHDHR